MTARLESLRWGIASLGAPQLHLEEILALAARYGLKQVELRTLGGMLDLPAYFTQRYGDPEGLRQALARDPSGIEVTVLSTGFHLTKAGETERQGLLDFVPWAVALGANWMRVFGGGQWGPRLEESALDHAVENVAWWRQERAKGGWNVDLLVETHDSLSGCEPMLRLQAKLGDQPLDILWDTHHTWRMGGEDPLETWEKLRPYTRQLHVKDSVGTAASYQYVPCGEGDMPALPILTKIAAEGFAGGVTLEWEKQWHPGLPPLEVALDAGRKNGWF